MTALDPTTLEDWKRRAQVAEADLDRGKVLKATWLDMLEKLGVPEHPACDVESEARALGLKWNAQRGAWLDLCSGLNAKLESDDTLQMEVTRASNALRDLNAEIDRLEALTKPQSPQLEGPEPTRAITGLGRSQLLDLIKDLECSLKLAQDEERSQTLSLESAMRENATLRARHDVYVEAATQRWNGLVAAVRNYEPSVNGSLHQLLDKHCAYVMPPGVLVHASYSKGQSARIDREGQALDAVQDVSPKLGLTAAELEAKLTQCSADWEGRNTHLAEELAAERRRIKDLEAELLAAAERRSELIAQLAEAEKAVRDRSAQNGRVRRYIDELKLREGAAMDASTAMRTERDALKQEFLQALDRIHELERAAREHDAEFSRWESEGARSDLNEMLRRDEMERLRLEVARLQKATITLSFVRAWAGTYTQDDFWVAQLAAILTTEITETIDPQLYRAPHVPALLQPQAHGSVADSVEPRVSIPSHMWPPQPAHLRVVEELRNFEKSRAERAGLQDIRDYLRVYVNELSDGGIYEGTPLREDLGAILLGHKPNGPESALEETTGWRKLRENLQVYTNSLDVQCSYDGDIIQSALVDVLRGETVEAEEPEEYAGEDCPECGEDPCECLDAGPCEGCGEAREDCICDQPLESDLEELPQVDCKNCGHRIPQGLSPALRGHCLASPDMLPCEPELPQEQRADIVEGPGKLQPCRYNEKGEVVPVVPVLAFGNLHEMPALVFMNGLVCVDAVLSIKHSVAGSDRRSVLKWIKLPADMTPQTHVMILVVGGGKHARMLINSPDGVYPKGTEIPLNLHLPEAT